MGRPSHHPSLDLFEPELTRTLDPPAEYPGRRPWPWPEQMPEQVREYISDHDGQWLKWESRFGWVWEAIAGPYTVQVGSWMCAEGEVCSVWALHPKGDFELEKAGQRFPKSPELQAHLRVMARLAGPGCKPLPPEYDELVKAADPNYWESLRAQHGITPQRLRQFGAQLNIYGQLVLGNPMMHVPCPTKMRDFEVSWHLVQRTLDAAVSYLMAMGKSPKEIAEVLDA